MTPKHLLLLVRPHIEDFAAYDHFSQPLGLFRLAAHLRDRFDLVYLDALDRFHPAATRATRRTDGTGNFHDEIIPKPAALADIPRRFRRYGLPGEAFLDGLRALPRKPAFALFTGGMTYWYTGLAYSISLFRRIYPDVSVILGGIYPSLLPSHAAEHSGADHVIPGRRLDQVLPSLGRILGSELSPCGRDPDYSLPKVLPFAAALSGEGCPFRCAYCASSQIGAWKPFPPARIAGMLAKLSAERGVKTVAWYDDALLFRHEEHFDVLLDELLMRGVSLRHHTPNGLHVRYLSDGTLKRMKKAGFEDLRLSLESDDDTARPDAKTERAEFERAVERIFRAGFPKDAVKTYVLANLPGQRPEDVVRALDYAGGLGATPMLAWYSPIPDTQLFAEAMELADAREPLAQNNTVHRYRGGWSEEDYRELKRKELGWRK
jgi:hypothetical protein